MIPRSPTRPLRGAQADAALSLHSWYSFRALFLVFGLWIVLLLEAVVLMSSVVVLMGASTLLVGLVVGLAMVWWSLCLARLRDCVAVGGALGGGVVVLVFGAASGLRCCWSLSLCCF
jgi:hypothetical protein